MVVESLSDKMAAEGGAGQTVQNDESFEIMGIRGPDYTLKVYAPRIVHLPEGSYTTYCVMLQTTSPAFRLSRSKTTRRFSDFVWLRKELNKVDNWRIWNLLDPKFITERRHQLEQWTHEILSDPAYLSNSALHLFLQTEMPVKDIIAYLEGRYPADKVEEIWQNQGKLYNYQAYNLLHNSYRQEPVVINFSPSEAASKTDSAATGRTSRPSVHWEEDGFSSPHCKTWDKPDHHQPAQSSASLEAQPTSLPLACGPDIASVMGLGEHEDSPDSGFFVQEVGDSSSHCANTVLSSSSSPSASSSTFLSSHLTTEKTMMATNSSISDERKEEAAAASSQTNPVVSASSPTAPNSGVEHLLCAGHSYTIN